MSCVPPVSGRVSAIKSQFENLSTLESLDVSGCKVKTTPNPKYQFQRAATSFDLLKSSDKVREVVKTWTRDDLPKQSSDTVLLRYKKLSKENPKNPKKSEKENVEVKLSRHTSDPVKRSSIKRSPAFRIGDKQNKTILLKQNPILPKEFDDERMESFLKRCVTDMEKLQQAGLTDSLKAALKQPLPTGPPPKKPPRTFCTNMQDEFFEDNPIVEESDPILPNACEFREKKSFLKNNLFLKSSTADTPATTTTAKTTKQNAAGSSASKPIQKSSRIDFSLPSAKFLNCISCHKDSCVIYDSVATSIADKAPFERKTNKISPLTTTTHWRRPNPAEHIYMEPYEHLGATRLSSLESARSTPNEEAGSSSICTCPENHSNDDLHYLCTAIDESIISGDIADKNEGLSLAKTYDEITILVNAAFQQQSNESENSSLDSRDGDNNENRTSMKLCRSLTEKRKDYVRRVSVVPQKKMQQYGTLHRTFKSPVIKTFSVDDDSVKKVAEQTKTIQSGVGAQRNGGPHHDELSNENIESTSERINKYKKLIDSNNSSTSSIKYRPKKTQESQQSSDQTSELSAIHCDESLNTQVKLFQVCLLVGYNTSSNTAYLKLKYPLNEPIPDQIEQLIFPSINLIRSGRDNQDYCLILTDDNGFKVYGYCRRVLPENSEVCLPLAYCIISITKALGFYQKLLKEIESRHGQSDSQLLLMLKNLQNYEIPGPGKFLHVKLPLSTRPKTFFSSSHKISPKRLSLETNPKWLTESASHAAFSEHEEPVKVKQKSNGNKSLVQEFEEKRQQPPFDLGLINRSIISRDPRFDEIFIRRPNDLRLENTELSDLFEQIGHELLIGIFASLLLERKVILYSKNISLLSKSILAIQSILYPFQWQYTIVTILPSSLIELCQAPFPVLVGILEKITFEIEDGILIDLDTKQILQCCGDEQTIIPDSLQESLKLSLEMVDLIDQGKMLSSVLISEAFLRFFVVLFSNYQQKYFNKDEFIQTHQSQKIKLFLEWFVETSMFRHFYNTRYLDKDDDDDHDNYYDLFEARLMEKSEKKTKLSQSIETIIKNSKIINKKGKSFKDRFKQFLTSN